MRKRKLKLLNHIRDTKESQSKRQKEPIFK